MIDLDLHIAVSLGLLLGMCLAAGVFADLLHLPKVTAYLLIGMIVGPSLLDLVPSGHVDRFEPGLKLAMSVVLFNLGCEFTFTKVRRIASRCAVLSFGDVLVTFVLVTAGLLLVGAGPPTALLLGCLAVATAPATTILVLKEFRSEGPVTECTGTLVAMNNFACIVLFEIAFIGIRFVDGGDDFSPMAEVGILVRDILGSMALGIGGGLVISYGCGLLKISRWLVLLMAAATFLLGICESLNIPYMLTFLVMGVTVANTSDRTGKIVDEMDHLTGLLAVLFFSVHGTELDVVALVEVGLFGMVYIACRSLGKWLGPFLAARASGQPLEIQHWLGSCLFSQAGAAIALATIAVQRDSDLGTPIQSVILGSVVVFEIVGPLLIRQAILRSGEVPLSQAIRHTSSTPIDQITSLSDRFRAAIRRTQQDAGIKTSITVNDLLRKNKGIHQSAQFEDVIAHIEHSHDNTYPVVDDRSKVVGLIRYPLLSNVMFDNTVAHLVCAEDLATETGSLLFPDEPADRAFELFQSETDDCIPVVSRDEPHCLLGVVRRRDVMHALMTQRRKTK